jgi:hypothetical protein
MHRFDELVLRPMLIYKYEKNMMKKNLQFFALMKEHGDEIEKDFNQDNDLRRSSMKLAKADALKLQDTANINHSDDEDSNSDAGSIGRSMRKIYKKTSKNSNNKK